MPAIRLYARKEEVPPPPTFRVPRELVDTIPYLRFLHRRDLDLTSVGFDSVRLRLSVGVRFGPRPPKGNSDRRHPVEAFIDTGAPFTLIPSTTWRLLGFPDFTDLTSNLSASALPTVTIRGTRWRIRLGLVEMSAFDLFQPAHSLPSTSVLAGLIQESVPQTSEPCEQPPLLMGMFGGILEGRYFWRSPTPDSEIVGLPDRYRLTFGQAWWLATAAV